MFFPPDLIYRIENIDSLYLIFLLLLFFINKGRKLYNARYSSGHRNYDWWELWYEKLF
jgi:hypothetical protein